VSHILNIAAYRFVAIDDPATLRPQLLASARSLGLKGTVLLAEEGINLFLAGEAQALRGWLDTLRGDARFAGLEAKESWSEGVPFRRLLVKCKREIIRMNHPAIRPEAGRAPAVDAPTLARWLDAGHDDAGRPLLLLDTRNGFEVQQGRFRGAVDLGIGKFGDFPAAAAAQQGNWEGHTIVSYCTGGIRCEKAAIYLAEHRGPGAAPVLQLDGGILKYFELVGGRHFDGHCVVFDDRAALDPALQPAALPPGDTQAAHPLPPH
jgi:UPF0176 protein